VNRLLMLAPAAALALLAVASTASAQTADPRTLMPELRREARASHLAATRLQRVVDRCEAPDENELLAVTENANALSHLAADLAPRVGGRDHVQALDIQSVAVTDFWHLVTLTPPDICYQPAAE
jgi:hypothetical protein